jgi:hypothetical protein
VAEETNRSVIEPSILGIPWILTISENARLENEADDAIRLRRFSLLRERAEDPANRDICWIHHLGLATVDSAASENSNATSAKQLPHNSAHQRTETLMSEPEKWYRRTLSTRNIRVAVVGNIDAGRIDPDRYVDTSSLDDGRGKSRTSIMKHRHEIESGRTSAASTHHRVPFQQVSYCRKGSGSGEA